MGERREIDPGPVVEIPADLLEQLEAIPITIGRAHRKWTPEQDAALLRYWPTRKKVDVAKALGMTVNPARDRYQRLVAQMQSERDSGGAGNCRAQEGTCKS